MMREIIDGYIFDVTKSLSRKDKKNVSELLEREIEEKLNEKTRFRNDDYPTYEEVKEVLSELGNPEDVAKKYSTMDKTAFLSPPFFRHYKIDFTIGFLVTLLTIIGSTAYSILVINGGSLDPLTFLTSGGNILLSFVIMYFCYTYSFNSVSRKRIKHDFDNYIDNLLGKPLKGNRIGKVSIVIQIVVTSILFGLLVFSDKVLGFTYPNILILDTYRFNLKSVMILVYLFSVMKLAYKEIDRRYSMGVLVTTIISNLSALAIAYIILVKNSILSDGMVTFIENSLPSNGFTNFLTSNPGLTVFLIIMIILIINLVYTAISYHSDKKSSTRPAADSAFEQARPEVVEDFGEEVVEVEEVEVVETPEMTSMEETTFVTPVSKDMEETTMMDREALNEKLKADKYGETIVLTKEELNLAPKNKIAEAVKRANPDNEK